MVKQVKLIQYVDKTASNSTTARINKAIALASVSDMRQKHGAVLVNGGRVISFGINTLRNSVQQHTHVPYDAISSHAEVACLSGLTFASTKGGKLYVARISYGGNIANSKPCAACFRYISIWTQVREVIYT